MNELDRILGILLTLQSRPAVTARQLAERFEVSTRTIYRDIQTMSGLGIPVYSERGRKGGIRLLPGYFLPPLMFAEQEAIALLLGLLLVRSLRVAPFPAEVESASQKLLAAMPEHLRATLARFERLLGVERPTSDVFHLEAGAAPPASAPRDESDVLTRFLQALLDQRTVRLRYQAPHHEAPTSREVQPLGLFMDRNWWYLVGEPAGEVSDAARPRRFWRADRVVELAALHPMSERPGDFDVGTLLGHAWLEEAMQTWRERAPVRLRITAEQAERLRADWYYRHALYEEEGDSRVLLTLGEADEELVLALVRWLGPGAELISPEAWRSTLRAQLEAMREQTS
jgi:predicted DNA-binding transcriptional regulator YafY